MAVSGATSGELPRQAKRLVQLMKKDHRVNYAQDWKMVTIMAGANDGCSYICDGFGWPWRALRPMDASPASFARNIKRTLDILQRDMPKTFVNLVPPPGYNTLSIFSFNNNI